MWTWLGSEPSGGLNNIIFWKSGLKNHLGYSLFEITTNFQNMPTKECINLIGTPHFMISLNDRASALTLCLPSQSDDDWPSAWAASNPITACRSQFNKNWVNEAIHKKKTQKLTARSTLEIACN